MPYVLQDFVVVAVDAKTHKLAGERNCRGEKLLAHIAEKAGLASGLAETRGSSGVQILSLHLSSQLFLCIGLFITPFIPAFL